MGNGSARFDSTNWLPATDPPPPLVICAEHIDDAIAIHKWSAEAARVLTVAKHFPI